MGFYRRVHLLGHSLAAHSWGYVQLRHTQLRGRLKNAISTGVIVAQNKTNVFFSDRLNVRW